MRSFVLNIDQKQIFKVFLFPFLDNSNPVMRPVFGYYPAPLESQSLGTALQR